MRGTIPSRTAVEKTTLDRGRVAGGVVCTGTRARGSMHEDKKIMQTEGERE